jgi:hypothetical protein
MFIASGIVPILSQRNNSVLFIGMFNMTGWKKPLQKNDFKKSIRISYSNHVLLSTCTVPYYSQQDVFYAFVSEVGWD